MEPYKILAIKNNMSGEILTRMTLNYIPDIVTFYNLKHSFLPTPYSVHQILRTKDNVTLTVGDTVLHSNIIHKIGKIEYYLDELYGYGEYGATLLPLDKIKWIETPGIDDGMELITTHICKGLDIGIHGNMFGGLMMALIDDASAAFAMQVCKTPSLVTIKADEFIFKKPVKAGNIVKIYGKVLEFGRTSVTLYIESRTCDPSSGTEIIVTHTNIKFVKIDDEGNAVPIDDEVKMNYK